MSEQRHIYVYDIPSIPDCTHHRLVTLCGGNAKEHVFRANEHLLRMVANFKDRRLALAMRFIFNPQTTSGTQERLRIQLVVRIDDQVSEETVKQLVNCGPLAEFYEIRGPQGPRPDYPLPVDFPAVCEVTRQEEKVKPLVSKEQNPGRIPSLYYSLQAFEACAENDHLAMDTLLSKMTHPCVVELLVAPVDQTEDLESQYKYITRLMSVNEYGDDSQFASPSDGFLGDGLSQRQATLSVERKRDPMADEIAREHQELYRKLRQPQLLFNIKAYAMNAENALMLASAMAESGLSGGKYQLISYSEQDPGPTNTWPRTSRQDSMALNVSLHATPSSIWNADLPRGYRGMARLSRLATVDELKGIVRLPVAGYGSPRCIRKATDPRPVLGKQHLLIGDDLESGIPATRNFDDALSDMSAVFDNQTPSTLELKLHLSTLTKHMFVAGVPGSGKTTAVFNLLVQLFRSGIPFLVIEPVKTEYRVLKILQNHPDPSIRELAKQLRVYSPGNDAISPLRFNPLYFPNGIGLDEHIGQVLSCFEAAMPMGGPLQALIAEAVEEVYEDRQPGVFPQMVDLLAAAGRIMDSKKYEGEVHSNLQAAIEVRLGMLTRRSMGRTFQCQRSIPAVSDLLKYPTVIEMDYLSQDHACLLSLFLLSAIREQIKVDKERRTSALHHVTVIEEAHNIVGRTGTAKASEEIADPKAFAAQNVSRMLAELRALGEGIIIADQLPSAVAPEVVKNTGTKLAHRLVSNEDREDLGGAMLLDGLQIEEIARLEPGEAYFYTEGLHSPRRVRCLNANSYLRLADHLDAPSTAAIISKEDWFVQNKTARLVAEASSVLEETHELLEEISAWCKQNASPALIDLYDRWSAACSEASSTESPSFLQQCEGIIADCVAFQNMVDENRRRFTDSADRCMRANSALGPEGQDLKDLMGTVAERWNEVEKPQLESLYTSLEGLETTVRDAIEVQS